MSWEVSPAIEWLEDPVRVEDIAFRGGYARQLIQEIEDYYQGTHPCLESEYGTTGCMESPWHFNPDFEIDIDMWVSDGSFYSPEAAKLVREARKKERITFEPLETIP